MKTLPELKKKQYSLLEKLSNACGMLSDVGEIRKIVRSEITGFCDEIRTDALGNLIAIKKAAVNKPIKVLIAAHMDEVGLMVAENNEQGLYRLAMVGGLDVRYLPGKSVLVGADHLPGIIGAKPIHLTKREERKNTIELEGLKLDMGPDGGSKAKPGDPVYFSTQFRQTDTYLIGKALDDRLGVAGLIYLLQNAPENVELQAVFTTQEEVGLRGARAAAYALNPDVAIAFDCTPAHDYPHWNNEENLFYNTICGKGPALYVADSRTISHPGLLQHFVKTADRYQIPYQIRQPGGGGTDAGTMHRRRAGIPSISISVPGRYAHSPVMMAQKSDWKNTISLLYHGLTDPRSATLKQE